MFRPCTHKIRLNVRFAPKATELLRRREMSRCAINQAFPPPAQPPLN
jgi:hypothetical protein